MKYISDVPYICACLWRVVLQTFLHFQSPSSRNAVQGNALLAEEDAQLCSLLLLDSSSVLPTIFPLNSTPPPPSLNQTLKTYLEIVKRASVSDIFVLCHDDESHHGDVLDNSNKKLESQNSIKSKKFLASDDEMLLFLL
jgi:hypothetical protein